MKSLFAIVLSATVLAALPASAVTVTHGQTISAQNGTNDPGYTLATNGFTRKVDGSPGFAFSLSKASVNTIAATVSASATLDCANCGANASATGRATTITTVKATDAFITATGTQSVYSVGDIVNAPMRMSIVLWAIGGNSYADLWINTRPNNGNVFSGNHYSVRGGQDLKSLTTTHEFSSGFARVHKAATAKVDFSHGAYRYRKSVTSAAYADPIFSFDESWEYFAVSNLLSLETTVIPVDSLTTSSGPAPVPVPVPPAAMLLASGLLILGAARRRRTRQ